MKHCYVVKLRDLAEDGVLSLRVRKVEDSDLGPAFICLSGFVFDQDSVIIDPDVEKLKKRFEDTKRLHVSLYHVISVEEVGRRNPGLSLADRSAVIPLPRGGPDEPGRD